MFKYEIGVELKDKITGFTGLVMGRTEYLNGCNRYSLQCRQLGEKGAPQEWQAFDEMQLEAVDNGLKLGGQRETGGPQPSARDLRRDAQR